MHAKVRNIYEPGFERHSLSLILDVDPDHAAECLEPSPLNDLELFPPHQGKWKSNAVGRVSAVQGSPKTPLDERQLRQIEDSCYDTLSQWGYLKADEEKRPNASAGKKSYRRRGRFGLVRRLLVYESLIEVALRLPFVYAYSEVRRRGVLLIGRLGFRR